MDENMKGKDSIWSLFWRGCVMGIAEVIPGVSGGTIAFITGIYERLLSAISSWNYELFSVLKQEGIKPFILRAELFFIAKLLVGMAVGVVLGVTVITHVLLSAPTVLWAFFFGLILASVFYMLQQTNQKDLASWILFGVSAVVTYMVVNVTPASGSDSLLYVFLCGAIAICALILPGISGSFVLLLLGMYTFIIPKVKSLLLTFNGEDLLYVGTFAFGCLIGLISFAKLLKHAFESYRHQVLLVLSGLMLGSLSKIWPWRNPMVIVDKNTGASIDRHIYLQDPLNNDYKLVSELNVLPTEYIGDPKLVISLAFLLIGLSIVLIAMKIDLKSKA